MPRMAERSSVRIARMMEGRAFESLDEVSAELDRAGERGLFDLTAEEAGSRELTSLERAQVTVTGNHTYTTESPVSGFNVVTTIDHEGVISMATSTAIVGRPGKVTGGGKIGDSREFDLDVQPDKNNGFKGHLNYKDKTNNVDLRSTSITFVSSLIDNKHPTIKGTATVNGTSGYTFNVHVEDNGEQQP
jgi:hypothetical protein